MAAEWSDELFNRLKLLKEENGGNIDINNIDGIIKKFLEILSPYLRDKEKEEIYNQLEEILVQFVALKRDVSNISQNILSKNFVPDITMDLRSVILQTEKSVTNILDICDEISDLAHKVNDNNLKEELLIKSTRILEICNFQDITGQRIQRIVHHLNEIESIIYKMLHILKPDLKLKEKNKSDDNLINGPQKSSEAPSQEDIDALFNSV